MRADLRRDTAACVWCSKSFSARSAGKPQQFCCAAHRRAFWEAIRAYGAWLFQTGQMTLTDLKAHRMNVRVISGPSYEKPRVSPKAVA
jgi:hypothetical protein